MSGHQQPALPTVIRGPEPRVVTGSFRNRADSAVSADGIHDLQGVDTECGMPSRPAKRPDLEMLRNRVTEQLAMAVRPGRPVGSPDTRACQHRRQQRTRGAEGAAEPHANEHQVSATIPDGGEPSGTGSHHGGGSGIR